MYGRPVKQVEERSSGAGAKSVKPGMTMEKQGTFLPTL